MRYTAKARMLAYSFSEDEVVRRLPATHALALAFMIARADNLGRLPGEPIVLLSYLFAPKTPREDFDSILVCEVLALLAREKVVHWYSVDGTRYVELARWAGHQKIRHDLRKSDLPGPERGVSVDVDRESFEVCPGGEIPAIDAGRAFVGRKSRRRSDEVTSEVEVEVEAEAEGEEAPSLRSGATVDSSSETKSKTLALVSSLASGMTLSPPAAPRARVAPPTEPAWEWLRTNATKEEAAEAMKLVGWLVRTGTKDGAVVLALAKAFVVHKPKNPFAYFTLEGNARKSIAMRTHADRAILEHEERKREERRFLGMEP